MEEIEELLVSLKCIFLDIKKWDDELEEVYGDPGLRAEDGLNKINEFLSKNK